MDCGFSKGGKRKKASRGMQEELFKKEANVATIKGLVGPKTTCPHSGKPSKKKAIDRELG